MRASALLPIFTALSLAAGSGLLGQETLAPTPGLPSFASPPTAGEVYFDLDAWLVDSEHSPIDPRTDWSWQLLPDGILYRAYLADTKASRLGTQVFHTQGNGTLWDSTLGGQVGLLRFGTREAAWAQGWQFDLEGSAQVRLDPDEQLDLQSVDYRVGAPLTYAYGRHRIKLGYYHLCAHLGDEFIEANPSFRHVNFVRDTLTAGYAYYVTEKLRVYGEMGWSFYDDVSEPWEFRFGVDFAPAGPTGLAGEPFFAVHGHLREEIDFSGNLVVQAGWAWRGERSSHLLRTGLHYYNGLSNQFSFYQNFEQQIGGGLWYDF